MNPTRRADELFNIFNESVRQIDNAVESHIMVDPSSTTQEFRLCLTDLGEIAFLPPILRHFTAVAPHAVLDIVPMQIDRVPQWLMRGTVDAAIASVDVVDAEHSNVLRNESYVCLVAEENSALSEPLTMAEFTDAPHVAIDPSLGHSQVESALERMGISRRVALKAHHFSVLPHIVTSSPYVAILPRRVAQLFADRWPLTIRELPFALPAFSVNLYWNKTSISPSQVWFRQLIHTALHSETDQRGAR